jgi:hypothetical protein
MTLDVKGAIASIERCLREASNSFAEDCYGRSGSDDDTFDESATEYYVERSFVELLILLESLQLTETWRQVAEMFELAKKEGLGKSKMGPDEPYLFWNDKIRMFADGVAGIHGLGDTAVSEIRDLKSVIRRSVYAICDTAIFSKPPAKEADVHDRVEAILKCHFADLKRKPALTKPIKNFEPDTGIPSIKTLIEFKFVTTKLEAKRVVDEILADTSGYRTPQWKNLLFVIYETRRVMPEEDWTALFRECELGSNYDAIVLSGDAKLGV